MKQLFLYKFMTSKGVISLIPEHSGRYKVMFGVENLGSYHSAQAAAQDTSGGHTFSSSCGTDFSTLGIPDDINDWEKFEFAKISDISPK